MKPPATGPIGVVLYVPLASDNCPPEIGPKGEIYKRKSWVMQIFALEVASVGSDRAQDAVEALALEGAKWGDKRCFLVTVHRAPLAADNAIAIPANNN